VSSELADAYGRSAAAWAAGPDRVYGALARDLVARSPVPLAGRVVADIGAGRGAATRALRDVGATPIALDVSEGMLAAGTGGPVAVADCRALPIADGALGGAVAAFSLNHLRDPVTGLAEARRATAMGGCVLVSAYAEEDAHPAKAAVEGALRAVGWTPPPWYAALQDGALPQLATVERAEAAALAAGLDLAVVTQIERPFPELGPTELVDWRLGLAMAVPFLADAGPDVVASVRARALDALGSEPDVLVRRVVVIAAVV
jgi:ubiquinone/menaquinone biosynthesis C-methylase UbiE